MEDIERTLLDYALDRVSLEESAMIQKELSENAALQRELENIQNLLVEYAPQERRLPSNLRAQLVAAHSSSDRIGLFRARLADMFDLSATAVETLLQQLAAKPSSPWENLPLSGALALHFQGGPAVGSDECGLVFLEPGTTFPEHAHVGEEVTLVLQGEIREDNGHVSLPGDVRRCGPNSRHAFTAQGSEPLIFAVRHSGIKIENVRL